MHVRTCERAKHMRKREECGKEARAGGSRCGRRVTCGRCGREMKCWQYAYQDTRRSCARRGIRQERSSLDGDRGQRRRMRIRMRASDFISWIDCGNNKKVFSNLSISAIQYYSNCLLCRSCFLVKYVPHLDCASQSETAYADY